MCHRDENLHLLGEELDCSEHNVISSLVIQGKWQLHLRSDGFFALYHPKLEVHLYEYMFSNIELKGYPWF